MIDLQKLPVDIVKACVRENTFVDFVKTYKWKVDEIKEVTTDPEPAPPLTWRERYVVKKNQPPIQLFQIMKLLWTEELYRILMRCGYKDAAEVATAWLPGFTLFEDGSITYFAEMVGMDWAVEFNETRDYNVKQALKKASPGQ